MVERCLSQCYQAVAALSAGQGRMGHATPQQLATTGKRAAKDGQPVAERDLPSRGWCGRAEQGGMLDPRRFARVASVT